MSVPEIVYRIRAAAKSKLEKAGWGLAVAGVAQGPDAAPWCTPLPRDFDVSAYLSAAERILLGGFDVFALKGVRLGFPPNWHRDPKTRIQSPELFGKTLNYRDESIVGDIKYLWEPNRHLELVRLAQAWHLSRDGRYLEGCRRYLESWFDQCRYPMGVNWTSSLELGIRLLNWCIAWHLIGGDRSPAFTGDDGESLRSHWLESIFQHCHFIAGHLSFHSSANNHLLGEYMGLLIGAITWPKWPQSALWQETGLTGFESEALLQNGADGVNREQAFYYQHEVIDMMLLCGLIGRANSVEFGTGYWQRLEKLIEFVAAVMDRGGHMPMIGDSDDAVMVRFSAQPDFDAYRSLLATGAVMFDRPTFALKAGHFDDKSRWLIGDAAQARFQALLRAGRIGADRALPRTFPVGGYFLLGDRLDEDDEIRLLVDAGPLGYLSIAAHGHADALSFTLSVAGQELLIDPGTYAYHTQRRWREYFKGTSAHNTVRVDAKDQSVSGGSFMWHRHARARCETYHTDADQDRFVGSHDGYLRLGDPVKHRREIVLDKLRRSVQIRDQLECRGPHEVELHWHFAEDCEVTMKADGAVVRKGPVVVRLDPPQGLRCELVVGREEPPLGWVSRRFDVKQPTPVIRCYGQIDGTSMLRTDWTIRMNGTPRSYY